MYFIGGLNVSTGITTKETPPSQASPQVRVAGDTLCTLCAAGTLALPLFLSLVALGDVYTRGVA